MEVIAQLDIASLSDTGQVRAGNEDATALAPDLGVVILADGMGGYNAGEVASGMACALLKNEIETSLSASLQTAVEHHLLQGAIGRTNDAIVQLANSQAQYAGMGTTLVLALFHGQQITVAHLGDSRLYRLRGKQLQQITADHSVLQAQIDAGILTKEQARVSQNKNLVTRALGVEATVQAEIHTWPTEPGDLYLLCSDGLSDMVEDSDIETMLNNYGHQLPLCADQLIAAANQNGGRDNITAILVKVIAHTPVSRNPVARLLKWLK
jgi:PPM family protein phosphatase